MNTQKVLIVRGRLLTDFDIEYLQKLTSPLSVEIFTEGHKLLSTMSKLDPSNIPLVIIDIQAKGNDGDGFSLVQQYNALFLNTFTRFILIGAYPTIDEEITTNLGAYFLEYPLENEAANCHLNLIQACIHSPRRYSHQIPDSFPHSSTSSAPPTPSKGNK